MNFERKCSVMGRKMKFGCLVKKGVAEVRERDLPEVGPYDVLLHMKVCNICTTDYGQWLGLREHQGYPMAGGHEAAGIVEQVGEKVTDLKVGDMVATGYEGCGHCPACREGHIDQCEEIRNDTEDGYKWGFFGFSNYCVKNSSGVYKVANDLNPSEAGFMEPLATVIHGAKKLRLKPFETVVVPKKIETAKAMGFEVIDCNESDPVEKVKELTEGIGADAVIVAVGATSANSQGLEMLKQNDGRMLLFAAGYTVPELKVDSNMLHYRKMELIGTFGADHEDFKEAAQALSTKVVDVSKLVEEKKFPLSRLQEAYEEASKPGMYRVSVMLDEE